MAIIQKISSYFTRKEQSKLTSAKMEKDNKVDDKKNGNKNVAHVKPVGKRTVWQRLKDKRRKHFPVNYMSMIDAIIYMIPFIIGFMVWGGLINPFYLILSGILLFLWCWVH